MKLYCFYLFGNSFQLILLKKHETAERTMKGEMWHLILRMGICIPGGSGHVWLTRSREWKKASVVVWEGAHRSHCPFTILSSESQERSLISWHFSSFIACSTILPLCQKLLNILLGMLKKMALKLYQDSCDCYTCKRLSEIKSLESSYENFCFKLRGTVVGTPP